MLSKKDFCALSNNFPSWLIPHCHSSEIETVEIISGVKVGECRRCSPRQNSRRTQSRHFYVFSHVMVDVEKHLKTVTIVPISKVIINCITQQNHFGSRDLYSAKKNIFTLHTFDHVVQMKLALKSFQFHTLILWLLRCTYGEVEQDEITSVDCMISILELAIKLKYCFVRLTRKHEIYQYNASDIFPIRKYTIRSGYFEPKPIFYKID